MPHSHTGVIEFRGSGHRLWYASIFAETIKRWRPSSTVSLVTSNKVRCQEDFVKRFGSDISPFDKVLSFDSGANEIESAKLGLRREGLDECVLLDADLHLLRLATTQGLGVPTGIQIMRAPEFRPNEQRAKSAVANLAKAALIAAVSFRRQNRSVAMLQSPLWQLDSPAQILTRLNNVGTQVDLVPPQSSHRCQKTTDLLVIGGLSERKYIRELADALKKVPRDSAPNVRFLGHPTPAVADALTSLEDKAFVELSFIDDERLDAEVSKARYVWCVYNSDLPSGIALRAISHESMLVAKSQTRLGRFVRANKVGVALNPQADLVNFLSKLSNDDDSTYVRPPVPKSSYCQGCFVQAALPSPLPHKCDQ